MSNDNNKEFFETVRLTDIKGINEKIRDQLYDINIVSIPPYSNLSKSCDPVLILITFFLLS